MVEGRAEKKKKRNYYVIITSDAKGINEKGWTYFSSTYQVNQGAVLAEVHLRSASTFSRDLGFDFMTRKFENPVSHI